MLCLFYYAEKVECLNETNFIRSQVHCDEVMVKLELYRVRATNSDHNDTSKDHATYGRIMHLISQPQLTYRGYSLVNGLFDHPFYRAQPDLFNNFSLIYGLAEVFWKRKESMYDLAEDMPKLVHFCEKVRKLVGC